VPGAERTLVIADLDGAEAAFFEGGTVSLEVRIATV
jgi:hypothetical protein